MTRNLNRIRIFRLQIVSHLAYCIVMLAHLILTDLPKARAFQGLAFFSIYVIMLCGRWNYDVDVAVVQTINSAMEFEAKLIQGNLVNLNDS